MPQENQQVREKVGAMAPVHQRSKNGTETGTRGLGCDHPPPHPQLGLPLLWLPGYRTEGKPFHRRGLGPNWDHSCQDWKALKCFTNGSEIDNIANVNTTQAFMDMGQNVRLKPMRWRDFQ